LQNKTRSENSCQKSKNLVCVNRRTVSSFSKILNALFILTITTLSNTQYIVIFVISISTPQSKFHCSDIIRYVLLLLSAIRLLLYFRYSSFNTTKQVTQHQLTDSPQRSPLVSYDISWGKLYRRQDDLSLMIKSFILRTCKLDRVGLADTARRN